MTTKQRLGRTLAIMLPVWTVIVLSVWFVPLAAPPMVSGQTAKPQTDQLPVPLIVATGASGGSYAQFFNEINRTCTPMEEWHNAKNEPSTGSVRTLDALLQNQANLGFVQVDTLWARATIDKDANAGLLKVLLPLYPEEVHLLTRASTIRSFSEFSGKRIRAWGGSFVTGKVLFYKTGIRPQQFFEVPNRDTALQQVERNEADAILAVGGQPMGWVRDLPAGWRLVPFDMPDKLRDIGVYEPATLNYSNLSPSGIATVAVQSSLVTIDYKSMTKVRSLITLRDCIWTNLDELRETTGNHPKWRVVSPKTVSSWPLYRDAPPATPAPIRKK